MTIELVQGDTGPQIKAAITRDGSVEDLTGCTAVLRFRKKRTSAVLFTLSHASSEEQLELGELYFVFSEGQLDLDEGFYEGEIEIVVGAVKETIYEKIEFFLREDFG